jgi:hypothetical protein
MIIGQSLVAGKLEPASFALPTIFAPPPFFLYPPPPFFEGGGCEGDGGGGRVRVESGGGEWWGEGVGGGKGGRWVWLPHLNQKVSSPFHPPSSLPPPSLACTFFPLACTTLLPPRPSTLPRPSFVPPQPPWSFLPALSPLPSHRFPLHPASPVPPS